MLTPNWASAPKMTKRQKYASISIGLTLALAVAQTNHAGWVGDLIWIMGPLITTFWALDFDLKREEWWLLPTYPLLWSISVLILTSQIAPATVWWGIELLFFGVGFYGLLLATNIINISTLRPLPLVRTATTVMYLYGLWCGFILLYALVVRQLPVHIWVIAASLLSCGVSWPLLWISEGQKQRTRRSLRWVGFTGLIVAELSLLVSFWPSSFMTSLLLATTTIVLVGIIHQQTRRLLTSSLMKQYLFLEGTVVLLFYLFSKW